MPPLDERLQTSRWETDGGRARLDRPTPTGAEQDHVARQMAAVADRLCREFTPDGGPAATALREQVRDTWSDFGSPRVIAYLPVLVERTVRAGLGRAGR